MVEGFQLPITDIAVTRYGLSSDMALEPVFLFVFTNYGDGEGSETEFGLSLLLNKTIMGHSKTNVYLKARIGFEYTDHLLGDGYFTLGIPFGYGLEHFVSEHLSINLGAMSGLRFYSNDGSIFGIRLSNAKPFAFYLLRYYYWFSGVAASVV